MAQVDELSVLLVEDDPVDAALFRSLLGHARGLTQHHASSLAQALEVLAAEAVDLVVLDLSLPDSDAAGTYNRLAEAAPDVAVIVLTGNDDQESAYQALSDGAQDYLVKHEVTEALLAKSVRYAVERQVAVRRRRRLRVHELEVLASLASGSDDAPGLAERAPGDFEALVAAYGTLLAGDVDDSRAGAADLARVASRGGATPADLAAVHATALRRHPPGADGGSVVDEGEDASHLVLLRVVGELANEYRRRGTTSPTS